MIHKDLYTAIQAAFKKERLYFGAIDGVWNKDTANAYQGWCLKNNVTGSQTRQQPTGLHDIEPNLRNLITGISKAAPTPPTAAPVAAKVVTQTMQGPVVAVVETETETETETEQKVEAESQTETETETEGSHQGQGQYSKHSKNRR